MAEDKDDSQEKTEDPSQRKLDKAREDGKVLTSKEMFVFTSLAMALLMLNFVGDLSEIWLQHWRAMFQFDDKAIENGGAVSGLLLVTQFIIVTTIIVGVPLMIVTVLTQFMIGGINFAPKSFSFKGNKLNPISGLARIFSVKGLVELGKSILKVVLLFAISGYVILPAVARNCLDLVRHAKRRPAVDEFLLPAVAGGDARGVAGDCGDRLCVAVP